jgi:hypothetical protein
MEESSRGNFRDCSDESANAFELSAHSDFPNHSLASIISCLGKAHA